MTMSLGMSERLTALEICRNSMEIFAELATDAEIVDRKGPRSEPWTIKTVLIDLGLAFPESIEDFRERELRPALTTLCASMPKKLQILRFRELNQAAVNAAQVEYGNLSLRCHIYYYLKLEKEIAEISIIVNGTA